MVYFKTTMFCFFCGALIFFHINLFNNVCIRMSTKRKKGKEKNPSVTVRKGWRCARTMAERLA